MKIILPWPQPARKAIVPIFLPFMGCRTRCVFCAQDRQTGLDHVRNLRELRERLLKAEAELELFRQKHGKSAELAFYSGTFTALPEEAWKMCLSFLEKCLSTGLISSMRCSTRPDALENSRLGQLKDRACQTIELGVQTFNDKSLNLSKRGYQGSEAMEACVLLKKMGFALGVQLLPGMPGTDPESFCQDVALACSLKASLLRFYPCLVLEGTGLAEIWRKGLHKVWSMPETVNALARALNTARKANVAVSRIGLAPEDSLAENILAGPYHPCLGSRAQAVALYFAIREMLAEKKIARLQGKIFLPRHVQGFFWGWKGELKTSWAEIGLDRQNVSYWSRNYIEAEL